ncbi:hypothetical protein NQ314_005111 [Rhamnusium bicolor]|uniref:Uncharacterized protein n=1 Tax=Rhamnusium bicolor TaxID=1586634 RepID=A0AAV8ZHC3_9CUCU|nr:hypothetical protein NQ314_005111 [Rhamnusium bicolor]
MSYEAEQQKLQRLLEECISDESDENDNTYDDNEEEGAEDNVEEREESTDTEQKFEDVEIQLDSHREDRLIFTGKDGTTIWRKHPLRKMVRRGAKNIVTQVPGVKGPAQGIKDPLEIFNLFFDDGVLDLIIENTNNGATGTSIINRKVKGTLRIYVLLVHIQALHCIMKK